MAGTSPAMTAICDCQLDYAGNMIRTSAETKNQGAIRALIPPLGAAQAI